MLSMGLILYMGIIEVGMLVMRNQSLGFRLQKMKCKLGFYGMLRSISVVVCQVVGPCSDLWHHAAHDIN